MGDEKRKKNRGIFIKLTRKSAEKEIQRRENKLNRELSRAEKRKIMERVAKRAKVQTAVIASVGILGFGTGYTVKGLVSGENVKTIEQETESDQTTTTKDDGFRKSLQVKDTAQEKLETEISELKTQEQVSAYLKNFYIEEYAKETGNDNLTTADIKIIKTPHDYVYQLENGVIVTHGQTPNNTEKDLNQDAKYYEIKDNVNIYAVRLSENDNIMDAMAKTDNGLQKAIPGDRYTEMKDYNSTLVKMGSIVEEAYDLMEAVEDLEKDSKNQYVKKKYENAKQELVDAITKYNISNTEIKQGKTELAKQEDLDR